MVRVHRWAGNGLMPLGNPYRALLGAAGGGDVGWIMIQQNQEYAPSTWFASQQNNNEGGSSVTVGTDGHIYAVTGADFLGMHITKYTTDGVQVWQRYMQSVRGSYSQNVHLIQSVGNIKVDSAHNVYVNVSFLWSTDTYNWSSYPSITKYDSSGTHQYTRIYTTNGTTAPAVIGSVAGKAWGNTGNLAIDSSDNVIFGGPAQRASATGDSFIAKVSNTGANSWSPGMVGYANEGSYWYGQATRSIGVDSSDNIYAGGISKIYGAITKARLSKFDSSGVEQWQRSYEGAGQYAISNGTADPTQSGGVLSRNPGLYTNAGGDTYMCWSSGRFLKINNAGVEQWNQNLATKWDIFDISEGNDGWLYFVAQDTTYTKTAARPSNRTGAVGRLNAATGALGWINKLEGYRTSGSTQQANLNGVEFTVDGVIVSGYTSQSGSYGDALIIAKLPLDGTGTGTWSTSITDTNRTVAYTMDYTALVESALGAQSNTTTTTTYTALTAGTGGSLMANATWASSGTALSGTGTNVNSVTNI